MKFRIPVYKNLQDEQKVGYWTVFSNIVLILVTFWLGLYVQDLVAKRNSDASGVLANVEYAKNVKPIVDSLNVKYGSLCLDMTSRLNEYVANPFVMTIDLYSFDTARIFFNSIPQNDILSYCSDVSKASVKVNPYMQHLTDTLASKAAIIPLTNDIYDFIMNQYPIIHGLVQDSLKDHESSYICDSVKRLWVSNWDMLNYQLKETLCDAEYLANFGIMTTYDTKIAPELKNIYNGFIDNVIKNYKDQLAKQKTMRIKQDVDFKYLYLLLAYQFLEVNILKPSLENHVYLSNHTCFKHEESNAITSFIVDNPIKALILVLLVGVLLAWIILQTLPRNNDYSKQKKTDNTYSDYVSELKYNAKLMKKLAEYGIDIPSKDEFENKK